jgi:hypothetical protein
MSKPKSGGSAGDLTGWKLAKKLPLFGFLKKAAAAAKIFCERTIRG